MQGSTNRPTRAPKGVFSFLLDYRIRSNFWKFYRTKIRFTLGEPVPVVKVFRLFKFEQMFFGVQGVNTVGRCTTSYISAGPAFVTPCTFCDTLFQLLC
jgi:hypothetical protein